MKKTTKKTEKKDVNVPGNEDISTEIKIGTQIWMVRNLDVTCFRNGDPIPEAKTDKDWDKAGEDEKPAFCYLNNKKTNGEIFGIIYNWHAINDPRGIAPEGFHVPTTDEWNKLIKYMGAKKNAGKKIKSDKYNGTNDHKFTGLVGGKRDFMGFSENISNWWTSTPNLKGIDSAFSVSIGTEDDDIEISGNSKSAGNYARCIKD